MECCTNVEKENNSVYIKLNEQKELAESVIDESIEKLNLLLNGIKNGLLKCIIFNFIFVNFKITF